MGGLIETHEIDEFRDIRAIPPRDVSSGMIGNIRELDEKTELEKLIREIIFDPNKTPHGPTEIADILSDHVHVGGRKKHAAFVLKGKGLVNVRSKDVDYQFAKALQINDLGLMVLAAVGHIQDDTKRDLAEFAKPKCDYLILDAVEIARLFIAYEKICPRDGTPYHDGRCKEGHRVDEGMSRLKHLRMAQRFSRARCIEKWTALGVPDEIANALADDPAVGQPPADAAPNPDAPLRLVTGDFGAGKSLLVERLYQSAVKNAIEDPDARIPVFLKSPSAVEDLEDAVRRASMSLGDVTKQGVYLIVDGLDEVGVASAQQVLQQARILVNGWHSSFAVLSSRPLRGEDVEKELFTMPELSDDDVQAILNRMLPSRPGEWRRLIPQVLREDMRRPFFAVLMTEALRSKRMSGLQKSLDPLTDLIMKSLEQRYSNHATVSEDLNRIGARSVDGSGGVVHRNEVTSPDSLDAILNSRIVALEGDYLRFTLPVLAQWFAARSFANGRPTVQELLVDPQRLERWYYPLTFWLGGVCWEDGHKVLSLLAAEQPGFATDLVKSVLAKRSPSRRLDSPTALECGRQVRSAMGSVANGLGRLTGILIPTRDDGSVVTVAARLDDLGVTIGWVEYGSQEKDVVPLEEKWGKAGISSVEGRGVVNHPCWAWEWVRGSLARQLSRLLSATALPPEAGSILWDEAMWETALHLTRNTGLGAGPIPLELIEASVKRQPRSWSSVETPLGPKEIGVKDDPLPLSEIMDYLGGGLSGPVQKSFKGRLVWPSLLKKHIKQLRENGIAHLTPPHPGPSGGSGSHVFGGYTDEDLLARTKSIFSTSLDGYQDLVETWFPKIGRRLRLYHVLPARLVGSLMTGGEHRPVLSWYLDPLPRGEKSSVDIELRRDGRPDVPDDARMGYKRVLSVRGEVGNWFTYSTHSEALDIFQSSPGTLRAYSWLFEDLAAVGVLDEKWQMPFY